MKPLPRRRPISQIFSAGGAGERWDASSAASARLLPPAQLHWRGQSMIVLRSAMRGILSDEIRNKPKFQDFTPLTRAAVARQRLVFENWRDHSILFDTGIVDRQWFGAHWDSFFSEAD